MIKNIAIHHSGGIGNNLTSSAFLTWQHINQAHKTRWNFPSQYIKDSYGGYNVVYDPKGQKLPSIPSRRGRNRRSKRLKL